MTNKGARPKRIVYAKYAEVNNKRICQDHIKYTNLRLGLMRKCFLKGTVELKANT